MAAILSIIVGTLLCIVGLATVYNGVEIGSFILKITGFICIIVSIFVAVSIYCGLTNDTSSNDTPQAIDVYRGKTVLQVTYRDSIPVDSIVVFRED